MGMNHRWGIRESIEREVVIYGSGTKVLHGHCRDLQFRWNLCICVERFSEPQHVGGGGGDAAFPPRDTNISHAGGGGAS